MKLNLTPIAASILLLFNACASDNEENTSSVQNTLKKNITLSETLTSDTDPVYRTDAFVYKNNVLAERTTTQTYCDFTTENKDYITREGNTMKVMKEGGTTFTYTLDEQGRAQTCVQDEGYVQLTDQFTYDQQGYLLSLTHTDADGNILCKLTLTWSNGELTSSSTDDESICQYSTDQHVESKNLPYFLYADVYPLDNHREALMEGILGNYPKHLITAMHLGETESKTYNYTLGASGAVTSIDEYTEWTGIVVSNTGVSSVSTTSRHRIIRID